MPLSSSNLYIKNEPDHFDQAVVQYGLTAVPTIRSAQEAGSADRLNEYARYKRKRRGVGRLTESRVLSPGYSSAISNHHFGIAYTIGGQTRRRLKCTDQFSLGRPIEFYTSDFQDQAKPYLHVLKQTNLPARASFFRYSPSQTGSPAQYSFGTAHSSVSAPSPANLLIGKEELVGLGKEREILLRQKYLDTLSATQSIRLSQLEGILASSAHQRVAKRRQSSEYKDRQQLLSLIRSLADALEKNLSYGNNPQNAKP